MVQPEVWLRGPLPGIPDLLQPVAHSLLQCREEVEGTLPSLTAELIWRRVGSAATVGYHMHHAIGSLDRLFSYARGETLSTAQLAWLANESSETRSDASELVAGFAEAVDAALAQVRQTAEETLLEARFVGRARLPSTVIGLLFHGAEHTQRHVGQMVSTAKLVQAIG